VLFNGDGHDYAAVVARPGRKEVTLTVNTRLPAVKEPDLAVTVVQAVSRGERMDQSLQKCTELGAFAFQPLISERVEVRLKPEKLAGRLEHWRSVIISACEQCGRAVIPAVFEPLNIADWLDGSTGGSRVVLVPGAATPLSGRKLPGPVELSVGPEGGFSGAELANMQSRGVQPVSLGPRILRTETAAAAAMAVLQSHFGDMTGAV